MEAWWSLPKSWRPPICRLPQLVTAGSGSGRSVRAIASVDTLDHSAVIATVGGPILEVALDCQGVIRRHGRGVDMVAVRSIAASPDRVYVGTDNGFISVRLCTPRVEPSRRILSEPDSVSRCSVTAHRGAVRALRLCPQTERLYSAGDDGAIHAWRWRDGQLRKVYTFDGGGEQHRGPILSLDSPSNGSILVTGGGRQEFGTTALWVGDPYDEEAEGDGRILVWKVPPNMDEYEDDTADAEAPGKPSGKHEDDDKPGLALRSRDRSPPLEPHGPSSRARSAQPRPRTPVLAHVLAGHSPAVHCLQVLRDGRSLLSGGSDGAVRHWDLNTGALLSCVTSGLSVVAALAVSPAGDEVYAAGRHRRIACWRLEPLPRNDRDGEVADAEGRAWSGPPPLAPPRDTRPPRVLVPRERPSFSLWTGCESHVSTLAACGSYLITGTCAGQISQWPLPLPPWTRSNHPSYPPGFRAAVHTFLLCVRRADCVAHKLALGTDSEAGLLDMVFGSLAQEVRKVQCDVDIISARPSGPAPAPDRAPGLEPEPRALAPSEDA